tara:strand:+ start:51 stop:260 length:210 start_codon:yes stop_codon:yes gene_type:complete
LTNFTKKEIDIIREMMFVGSVTGGIDIYQDGVTDEEYIEANKILYKLGFDGIGKDGRDLDFDVKDKKWK